MKKLIITSILAVLVAAGTTTVAQDYPEEYLGLPGDNLNLYAVMNLFQQSETLEGFERTLNAENSKINNLDLNGDNVVDYIMVTDYVDGNVHNIVLRVALNRKDNQDVAVFTVQKFRNGSAQIQLIGDEALYGRNYIVEPLYADNYGETPNPGYSGYTGNSNITVVRTTAFEVAAWPLVSFIFMPGYVTWRSSWYWGYYPSYWNPWRPYYWHYYYGYHYNWYPQYYGHYHNCHLNRYARYNDYYYSHIRSHSPYVSARINEGHYKSTYSHPEQRRDGEALYTKMYADRKSGTQDRNGNSSQARRSVSNQTQDRNGNSSQARRSVSDQTQPKTISRGSTDNVRRSINTNVDRAVAKPENGQKSVNTRRAVATDSKKAVTKTERSQYGGSTRKAAPSNPTRVVSGTDQARSTSTARRAPATISERVVSKPKQGQKAETSRQPRQATMSAGSSDRRSPKISKSGPSMARGNKAGESEAGKPSRRK